MVPVWVVPALKAASKILPKVWRWVKPEKKVETKIEVEFTPGPKVEFLHDNFPGVKGNYLVGLPDGTTKEIRLSKQQPEGYWVYRYADKDEFYPLTPEDQKHFNWIKRV